VPPLTVPQILDLGLQHHKAGRLVEAEAVYRQILAVQPNHADAWHMLGLIAHQAGHHDLALERLRQAIACDPNNATVYSNLGAVYQALGRFDEAIDSERRALQLNAALPEAHHNLGLALARRCQLEEAIASFRRAIQIQPNYAEAHYNLGAALAELNRLEEAVAALRQSLALNPYFAEAHNNLGVVLEKDGRFEDAIAAYRRALEIKPDYAKAHKNLGNALRLQGRLDEAIDAIRRALEINPDYAEAHNSLGAILADKGRYDEAMSAYRRALERKPAYAEALNNLGNALQEQGDFEAAVTACHRALELDADYSEAYNTLSVALRELGRMDEAVLACRRALELGPDAAAKFRMSILLLLRGDFEQGWPFYEARWEATKSPKRDFCQPMWDGSPLQDRRILIHAEQGFGDAIHFVRYAPLLAARGGEVVIECPRILVELFRRAKGVSEIVAAGDPLPGFDLHVPMLSVPVVLQTTRESIPQDVPYLFVDPHRRAFWKARLGCNRTGLRVGLAWAGNPQNRQNRKRNISLEMLLPLWRAEGVEFFSVQVGPGTEQIRQLPDSTVIVDHTDHIQDFADTAALIMELDLIISVDTAVAHLAGALARPVWTLLPFIPDWRWGLEGERTPWYPTMHLFRQPGVGDWDSVIPHVIRELRQLRDGGALASRNSPSVDR